MNERPSINLVNYDDRDNFVSASPLTSNSSSTLDTESSSAYSVINSVIINPPNSPNDDSTYKDRDNPEMMHSTTSPEFEWIQHLDGTWKPPTSTPRTFTSTHNPSLDFLSSFHIISFLLLPILTPSRQSTKHHHLMLNISSFPNNQTQEPIPVLPITSTYSPILPILTQFQSIQQVIKPNP